MCLEKRQEPADVDVVHGYVPCRKNASVVFESTLVTATTVKQLKDLVCSLSKKKSADAQILMWNYVIERFLECTSLSDYKDRFILKGGVLVAAVIDLNVRSMMDLDIMVRGASVSAVPYTHFRAHETPSR